MDIRHGSARAYHVSISEAGGGSSDTVLGGEVLHFRIATDYVVPWMGVSPLCRSHLAAGLLQSIESALNEVYDNAPIGSLIVPVSEAPETDIVSLGRDFLRPPYSCATS